MPGLKLCLLLLCACTCVLLLLQQTIVASVIVICNIPNGVMCPVSMQACLLRTGRDSGVYEKGMQCSAWAKALNSVACAWLPQDSLCVPSLLQISLASSSYPPPLLPTHTPWMCCCRVGEFLYVQPEVSHNQQVLNGMQLS